MGSIVKMPNRLPTSHVKAPAAKPKPAFKDSKGKTYDSEVARDSAQSQIDRKAKFPGPGGASSVGAKTKIQRKAVAGRPTVRTPSIGGLGASRSGVSI